MNPQFHHFGVPTSKPGAEETYIEDCKVFITDPEQHPYRIEFLRFEDGSPMPEILQRQPHAAWQVASLEEAIAGQEVVVEPFDATDTLRVAFITVGDALIELMEMR